MIRICFATNNEHKLREVRAAIPSGIEIVSLEAIGCFEELPETCDTLEGNSLQKANYVLDKFGIPCFADDTGLEVEALDGEPGVYSARYAGPQKNSDDNIRLLLSRLQNESNRKARFRAVLTLVGTSAEPLLFEGVIEGNIIHHPRGTGGFGYDPVFQPIGHSTTLAEMPLTEKNLLSHRGIAVKKISQHLLSKKLR
jgi:XTP/dITP diphosphohydrolase